MISEWDVAVIGGGIHGVGVAQAAAAAGYSVVILEKADWGAGTSSRSSKLIHGGLRYLQSGEFWLVRESLRERELLLQIAPDLVKRNWFYIPVYREAKYPSWQMHIGLSLYHLLAGLKANTGYETVPPEQWPQLNGIKTDGLQQVFRYHDAQTDDRLLTTAVAYSAKKLGAELLCPARLKSAVKTADGYQLEIDNDGSKLGGRCQFLVNAAGPWTNLVAQTISPAPDCPDIELVQGSHLVLSKSLGDRCYYLESPTDQRAVFVLPWKNGALLGTTETVFHGKPENTSPLPIERSYLLDVLKYYFPDYVGEVIDEFAGLRVLPWDKRLPFKRSRELQLTTDSHAKPHYLGIYGGKLTGYRASAQKVMSIIASTLGTRAAIADTATIRLELPE